VEEIFDVQIVPSRLPVISGPFAYEEGLKSIWLLPAATSNGAAGQQILNQ
jgi:hypothetical protein